MREMSYDIILNESYMLTGGVGVEQSARLRLTSQMPEGELEKLISFLVENCDEVEDTEKLAPYLPQIFRGEQTPWRIDTVYVDYDYFAISFTEDSQDIAPKDANLALLSTIHPEADWPRAKLRFESVLKDGTVASTTDISTGTDGTHEIDERCYRGNRRLRFTGCIYEETDSWKTGSTVTVTEYSW